MIDRLELARSLPINRTPERISALDTAMLSLRQAQVVDPGTDLQRRIHQNPVTRVFSKDTEQALRENDWVIYEDFETSLNWLQGAKKSFHCIVNGDAEWFKHISSRPSQIAILPHEPMVPKSANLSIEDQRSRQQDDLLSTIHKSMGITGVETVIGDAATHAAIAFAHKEKTNDWLIKQEFIRTDSRTTGYETYIVGAPTKHGLKLLSRDRRQSYTDISVLRLLVPA